MRTFDDRPATREKTPLFLGLVGPSGGGKTYSALRLATGIQRVGGGDIFVIDTEARRALHYAERFKFRHVPFGAPFSPADYLAAIEHCVKKGAGTVIVDSMSHEHEGPGGVLEMHAAAVERMSKGDRDKAERVKMAAWIEPKQQRRRLINALLQMECNFVFCFRAKEKMKIERGKDPKPLGFMPIAGEEFVYEMTMKALLLPGANGVPTWTSEEIGERAMIKLPEQFRAMFAGTPVQFSEDVGEQLARWAAGSAPVEKVSAADLLTRYAACSDDATMRALGVAAQAAWSGIAKDDRVAIKAAREAAVARLAAAVAPKPEDRKPDPALGEVDDALLPEPGSDG